VKVSRLTSKLKLFYITFLKPPKVWLLPEKSDVLIFDACASEALVPYLKKYSFTVMAVRRESINISCLLLSVFGLRIWKGNLLNAYFETYIRTVSPKIVITFIDNNAAFYSISHQFPDIKTVFLQNGIRSETGDVFGHLKKLESYFVDYMLVMGSAIGKKYNEYVSGSVRVIGSLINNAINYKYAEPDGSILFISQYRSKPENNAPFIICKDNKPYYHEQFYSAEVIVLRFLAKWCTENKKYLKVAGFTKESTGPEVAFFDAVLNGCSWEYMPRTDKYSSYKMVDAAEIVVFIDSTLGYEAIARGKKTAGFSCRGVSLNIGSNRFGWPAEIPDNGPFWSNDQDEMQFYRVMDYLIAVSDEKWEQIRKHYMPELIDFDPGNTKFITLLQELLGKGGGK